MCFLQQGLFDLPGKKSLAFHLVKGNILDCITLRFYNNDFSAVRTQKPCHEAGLPHGKLTSPRAYSNLHIF